MQLYIQEVTYFQKTIYKNHLISVKNHFIILRNVVELYFLIYYNNTNVTGYNPVSLFHVNSVLQFEKTLLIY
jgi:hypothetical protein